MLKQQILAAIGQARLALQDLAIEVNHVARSAAVFVPGETPTYPETVTAVSMVLTRFGASEIDGDRIQASDWRGIVFPKPGLADFNTNDIIRVIGGLQDMRPGDYRIVVDDKVMVGDAVALHQLQLRRL